MPLSLCCLRSGRQWVMVLRLAALQYVGVQDRILLLSLRLSPLCPGIQEGMVGTSRSSNLYQRSPSLCALSPSVLFLLLFQAPGNGAAMVTIPSSLRRNSSSALLRGQQFTTNKASLEDLRSLPPPPHPNRIQAGCLACPAPDPTILISPTCLWIM